MHAPRMILGLTLAGLSTMVGVAAALWVAANVATLAGDPFQSGWAAPMWLGFGAAMLLLGGIGLFIGYQVYFRITARR